MFPQIEMHINGRKESLDRMIKSPGDKRLFNRKILPKLYKLCNNDNSTFLKQLDSIIDYISGGRSVGNVAYMLQNPKKAIEQLKPSLSEIVGLADNGISANDGCSKVGGKIYGFARNYKEILEEGAYENGIKALEGD